MGQVLFKLLITVLFVVLFYLEVLSGIPLLLALVSRISGEVGTQTAAVTLVMSFASSTTNLGYFAALLGERPGGRGMIRLILMPIAGVPGEIKLSPRPGT